MSVERTLQKVLDEIRNIREDAQRDREQIRADKDQILGEIRALAERIEIIPELQRKIEHLGQENSDLQDEMEQLKIQFNLQDQYQKAKNLVLYGLPGQAKESRVVSEKLVKKIFTTTGVLRTPLIAHRLSVKPNSPMLVQFSCKQDAQETFQHIRRSNTDLAALGLGEQGKVEVRYHLSSHLGELLRSANIVRKEAGWEYCRPLTSQQAVELVKSKAPNSRKVTVRNIQELMNLKDGLLKDGVITMNSPANQIGQGKRPVREARRRSMTRTTRDTSKATIQPS